MSLIVNNREAVVVAKLAAAAKLWQEGKRPPK